MNTSVTTLKKSTDLRNLPVIALVRSGSVITQSFGASKFMIAGGRCNDVTVTSDLTTEPLDGSGDLIDFGEDDDARELRVWVF